jgi:ribosomal protein S18 acetylase RimI-like enzyme
MPINLRPAKPEDTDTLWDIFHEVGKGGDTYAHTGEMTKDQFITYWLAPTNHVYVAELDGNIAGTFLLRQNHWGRGSHIANGAYMVHSGFRGHRIGKTLGQHSIDEAKRLGFKAIQFNYVVSTNQIAINLWKSLGFNVIGTVPQGFNHAKLGMVDALIMHRFL